MITFRHILNKLHDGEICNIDVVTYDRKRRTGGQVKSYRCILAQKATAPAHRPSTPKKTPTKNTVGRDPNHKKWYTRNVQLVTNDDFLTPIIKKIHIPLIVQFNGQNVVP